MLCWGFFVCKAASRKPKGNADIWEALHPDSSLWTEVSFCGSVALSSLGRYSKASLCLSSMNNFFISVGHEEGEALSC